jgi:hypothetical protein
VSREPHAPGLPDSREPEELPLLEPAQERELAEALRAAWNPAPLDPAVQRQILNAALEDPFAEPTEDEIRESGRLRRALEDDDGSHADVELARALRRAVKPGAEEPAAPVPRAARSTARVVYVTFGGLALAAAAGFALFVARPRSDSAIATAPPSRALHASRPTGDLFAERFTTSGTTDRIDRIATARAHDLRENRYAAWGVR